MTSTAAALSQSHRPHRLALVSTLAIFFCLSQPSNLNVTIMNHHFQQTCYNIAIYNYTINKCKYISLRQLFHCASTCTCSRTISNKMPLWPGLLSFVAVFGENNHSISADPSRKVMNLCSVDKQTRTQLKGRTHTALKHITEPNTQWSP